MDGETEEIFGMMTVIERRGAGWATGLRAAARGGARALLLAPLVAMQFTDEVRWGPGDFVVAGVLLFGCAALIDRAVRRTGNAAYVAATLVAVGTGFVLTWANMAVGVIGDEDNPANLMFFAVVALAGLGALLARGKARRMAAAMATTCAAQVAALLAVLAFGWAANEPALLVPLLLVFAGGWGLAALLYRMAMRSGH